MGISEMKIYFGLKISQKKINAISVTIRKTKPSPIKAMIHHFVGSTYGARQASKNISAARMFRTRKVILVKRL